MNVQELRRNGYHVKIRHVRDFLGVKKVDENDCYMTRGEYEQARLNGELRFTDPMARDFFTGLGVADGKMPEYGKAVDSFGGWTEVLVTKPDGVTVKGKCNFSTNNVDRPFVRKVGLSIALSKALGVDKHNERQEKRRNQAVPLVDKT